MGNTEIKAWEHIFSSAYCNFIPAILVCTTWMLLPIPEIAKIGLFLWSLPLFTAGAAHTLHKGQDTLMQLIYRRCPVQGVMILCYTVGGLIVFFTLLLLSGKIGFLGTPRGASVFVAFLGVSAVMALYRFWPDYLLRIIYPWPGSTDSWIGFDTLGLGPGPWTSWKYTGRAGLPLKVTAVAVFSLLVIAGSVSILFSDLVQDHIGINFLLFLAVLTVIFPLAHLFLARSGYLLLAANGVTPKASDREFPDTTEEGAPQSAIRKQPKVLDDHAMIDQRAYELLKREIIITGWLYARRDGRPWNGVIGYNETVNKLIFVDGPNGTGHWGHEAYREEWEVSKALMDWFPERCHISQKARETVVLFLKDRQRTLFEPSG